MIYWIIRLKISHILHNFISNKYYNIDSKILQMDETRTRNSFIVEGILDILDYK